LGTYRRISELYRFRIREEDVRAPLQTLDPKACDDPRDVLIRDHADRGRPRRS